MAIVPPELQIVRANGPGQPKIEGQKITFPPVDSVQPNASVSYTVDVKALKEGDVRFHVELRSADLGAQPVIEEESTRIYAPLPGARSRTPGTRLGPDDLGTAAGIGFYALHRPPAAAHHRDRCRHPHRPRCSRRRWEWDALVNECAARTQTTTNTSSPSPRTKSLESSGLHDERSLPPRGLEDSSSGLVSDCERRHEPAAE